MLKNFCMRYLYVLLTVLASISAYSQNPFTHPIEAIEARYSIKQPVVNYTLETDTIKKSIKVEMRLKNVPHNFQVAMFAHPEYDDHYWRYIKDLWVFMNLSAGKYSSSE